MRRFGKSVISVLVMSMLIAFSLKASGEDLKTREKLKTPIRIVYHKWFYSKDYLDLLVERAKKAELNYIAYVTAVPYGKANYNSYLFPKNAVVTADYDPLDYIIKKAKESGIKVCAWTLLDNDAPMPAEVKAKYNNLKKNLDAKGNEGYRWYCVNNEDYIRLIKDYIKEICRYDIGMISWDDGMGFTGSAGWSGNDYCFDDWCINKFQKDTAGESLLPLKEATAKGKVPPELIPLQNKWKKWKEDCVAAFSRMLKEEANRIRPGVMVSSSGDSGDSMMGTHYARSQNVPKMIANGDMDLIEPELYYPHQVAEKNVNKWLESLGPNADRFVPLLINYGQAAVMKTDIPFTGKQILDELKVIKEKGVKNEGWFTSVYLTDEQCYVIKTGELPPSVPLELKRTPGKINILIDEHVFHPDLFRSDYSQFIKVLEEPGASVKVASYPLNDELLAQFDVMVVYPALPYRDEELWVISNFLEKGGTVLFFGKGAVGLKQMEKVLAKYGIGLGQGIPGGDMTAVKGLPLTEGVEKVITTGGNIEYPVNKDTPGAKAVLITADGKAAASMYEGTCRILIIGDDWALHNGRATIPTKLEVNKKFAENIAKWLVKNVKSDKKEADSKPEDQTEIKPIILQEGENSLKKIAENINNPDVFDYKDGTAICKANITVGKSAALKIEAKERLEMVCKRSGGLTINVAGKLLMNDAEIVSGGVGLPYNIANSDSGSIKMENTSLKGVKSFLSRGDLYAQNLLIDSENQGGELWQGSLHLQSGADTLKNVRLVNPGGNDVGLHIQNH